MAFNYMENISYKNNRPNFERDSVKTVAALLAVNPANKEYDYGHIVFCEENGKHYKFIYDYNNPPADGLKDASTGWFALLNAEAEESGVTTIKLAPQAVTTEKLADNSVGNRQIAPSSVGKDEIMDAQVIASKIADGAVTADKLSADVKNTIDSSAEAITAEADRAKSAEAGITAQVNLNVAAISEESNRAKAAEAAITNLISSDAEVVNTLTNVAAWITDGATEGAAAELISNVETLKSDNADNKAEIANTPYVAKMKQYGCNKLVFISSVKDLLDIKREDTHTYYVMTKALVVNGASYREALGKTTEEVLETSEIKFGENCVFDIGDFYLQIHYVQDNAGTGFLRQLIYLSSPFSIEDEDNFYKYPRILYNDKLETTQRGVYTSYSSKVQPIEGMWRVNDDRVIFFDFHRAAYDDVNKTLASFSNCRIYLDADTLIYQGANTDETLGVRSNVTLYGNINKIISAGSNPVTTRLAINITGDNVRVENLHIKESTTNTFTIVPKDKSKRQNFFFVGNSGSIRISSNYDVQAVIKENILDLSGDDTAFRLEGGYNCVITDNIVRNANYGITLFGNNNLIEGNTFENIKFISIWLPARPYGTATRYYGSYNNVVRRNIIRNNGEEGISTDSTASFWGVNMFSVDEVIVTTETNSSGSASIEYRNKAKGRFDFADDNILSYKNGAQIVALHKERDLFNGKILDIALEEDGSYTVTSDYNMFNNAQVGDKYMVVSPVCDLVVEDNYISDAMDALVLFGTTINATYRNNTIVATKLRPGSGATAPIYGTALFARTVDGVVKPAFKSYAQPLLNIKFVDNKVYDNNQGGLRNKGKVSFTTSLTYGVSSSEAPEVDVYADATDHFIKNIVVSGNDFKGVLQFTRVDDLIIHNNKYDCVRFQYCKRITDSTGDTYSVDAVGDRITTVLSVDNTDTATNDAFYFMIQIYDENNIEVIKTNSSVTTSLRLDVKPGYKIKVTVGKNSTMDNLKCTLKDSNNRVVKSHSEIVTQEYIKGSQNGTFEFTMPDYACVFELRK